MIDDPQTLELPSVHNGGIETSMVLEELPENEYDDSQRGDDNAKGSIFTGEKPDKNENGGARYSNLRK